MKLQKKTNFSEKIAKHDISIIRALSELLPVQSKQ